MKGDFGTLIWVNDKDGKEFVCTASTNFTNARDYDSLSEKEKKTCMDVSQIVGTERW
jgi:hypothetical protein